MEPLSPEEHGRLAAAGELRERIAFAMQIGNHLVDAVRLRQAIVRTARLYLESQGLTRRQIEDVAPTFLPPPDWRGMPTTGSARIFALLIEFSDCPHTIASAAIRAGLFGSPASGFPEESLSAYYRRSSYGLLDLSGTVLGWYNTGRSRWSVEMSPCGREALIKEALWHFASQGHDFVQYDHDGSGTIDYFLVFWTGPDTGWSSFWWGYETRFLDSTFRIDGLRLANYSWLPEVSPGFPAGQFFTRTAIHETGHALGLPDLYDYDDSAGPRGGVGGFDVMDRAGDHNCLSKWMLGWLSPEVIGRGQRTADLAPSASSGDCVAVWPGLLDGKVFTELYMVQHRASLGNDTGLSGAGLAESPKAGLAIWHVDATLQANGLDFAFDNSRTRHKYLRLMEADGQEHIEQGGSFTTDDLYVPGRTFGPHTRPSSVRYNTRQSWVLVDDIAPSDRGMSARVGLQKPG
jgi:M6 family metalloprotease-like protein